MINNFLKPCCNECMNIDVKANTSSGTVNDENGYLKRVCDTVIYCGHQYVCNRYIECEQEPNKI